MESKYQLVINTSSDKLLAQVYQKELTLMIWMIVNIELGLIEKDIKISWIKDLSDTLIKIVNDSRSDKSSKGPWAVIHRYEDKINKTILANKISYRFLTKYNLKIKLTEEDITNVFDTIYGVIRFNSQKTMISKLNELYPDD